MNNKEMENQNPYHSKSKVKLAIKYKIDSHSGICPLCGRRTEPQMPLAIFLENCYCDVCVNCSFKEAPELFWLLQYYYSNLQYYKTVFGEPIFGKSNELETEEEPPF